MAVGEGNYVKQKNMASDRMLVGAVARVPPRSWHGSAVIGSTQ